MALSSSAARGWNYKGVQVVWLKKSLNSVVEGEILAARLGPVLEKYLLKLVAMEVWSEISSPLLLKRGGGGRLVTLAFINYLLKDFPCSFYVIPCWEILERGTVLVPCKLLFASKILVPGTGQTIIAAACSVGSHCKKGPTISFGVTSCKELPAATEK